MQKKQAAFSGSWYPADARECQEAIARFLKEGDVDNDIQERELFFGGIVPHAGWYFSGSIACRVIAAIAYSFCLREKGGEPSGHGDGKGGSDLQAAAGKNAMPDVVVIFGMHMHPTSPACVMTDGSWETPLGDLSIHGEMATLFAEKTGAQPCNPATFPEENTIELQLPFVKHFFPDAAIVPVGVPPTPQAEIMGREAVLAAQALGLRMVAIGSTDMTHYGSNYGFSPKGSGHKAIEWVKKKNDQAAIDAMVAMDGRRVIDEGLSRRNLCCAGAVSATIAAAKALGAVKGIELDYATSYDKSPGESFVGYSGILFA